MIGSIGCCFKAQLEGAEFFNRVIDFEETDPADLASTNAAMASSRC